MIDWTKIAKLETEKRKRREEESLNKPVAATPDKISEEFGWKKIVPADNDCDQTNRWEKDGIVVSDDDQEPEVVSSSDKIMEEMLEDISDPEANPSYESGWAQVFPADNDPDQRIYWLKDGVRVHLETMAAAKPKAVIKPIENHETESESEEATEILTHVITEDIQQTEEGKLYFERVRDWADKSSWVSTPRGRQRC